MANIRSARRSGFVRRGGHMVRETIWGDVVATSTNLPGANSGVLINVTGAGFLALRPFTVVRLRGLLYIASDQAAASETQLAAFGACVVTDQAAAIGITAVPTPFIDQDSDSWFAYETMANDFLFDGGGQGGNTGRVHRYDSKAMRKVEDGSQVIFVIENSALAADGCNITHSARLLIKLH